MGGLSPEIILVGVFVLGTGFAFQAPVASASIPEIVGQEQLPSAIALGGIQMNLAGIIGPAIGGFLVPLIGVSSVFAMNALAFVLVLFAIRTWQRKSEGLGIPLESFFDSLAGALRYMLSGIVLAASYALMAIVRHSQVFFIVSALAGVAWTVSASELRVAGQRILPDWIRAG